MCFDFLFGCSRIWDGGVKISEAYIGMFHVIGVWDIVVSISILSYKKKGNTLFFMVYVGLLISGTCLHSAASLWAEHALGTGTWTILTRLQQNGVPGCI